MSAKQMITVLAIAITAAVEGCSATAGEACLWRGTTYSDGAGACQSGEQYRCEDGTWHTIGLPCAAGDSPIRIVPAGRACLFEGATIGNASTICRSGSTFLCSNGDWVNLGTVCR